MRFKYITTQSVLALFCSGLFGVNVHAAPAAPPPVLKPSTPNIMDMPRYVTKGDSVSLSWSVKDEKGIPGTYWRLLRNGQPVSRDGISNFATAMNLPQAGLTGVGAFQFDTLGEIQLGVQLCNPGNTVQTVKSGEKCTGSILQVVRVNSIPPEPILSVGNGTPRVVTRKVSDGAFNISWFTNGNVPSVDIGSGFYWKAWTTTPGSATKQLVHTNDTSFSQNSSNGGYHWAGVGVINAFNQIGTRIISVELCNPANRCTSSSENNSLTVITTKN